MNNNIFVSVFKFLFTVLSLVIILPGVFENDYRILTLSFAVFILCKLVDNIYEIVCAKHIIFFINLIQFLLGIISVAICFFYIAVIFSINGIDKDVQNIDKYPLIGSSDYPYIFILLTGVYVMSDLFLLIKDFYLNLKTKQSVCKIINK